MRCKITYPVCIIQAVEKIRIYYEKKLLQKTPRKMTNSLTLKQCHFVGQSSILFPKYICESFQGLYTPDRIRFFIPHSW